MPSRMRVASAPTQVAMTGTPRLRNSDNVYENDSATVGTSKAASGASPAINFGRFSRR